jgi:CHAT domain-containing protein
LHQPDIFTLEETLEAHEPNILHFIGHGRLRQTDDGRQVGELALVGVAGRPDWRTDEEIGEIFQVHRPGIILLQACESGAEGNAVAFVGVASQIVQRNVPVVVAMQYPVSNAVAVTFSEAFYRRLGRLEPVDVAVQRGRRRLKHQFRNTRDFAAPVLLMRVENGRLFVSPEQPAPERQEEKLEETEGFFDDKQRQAAENRLVIRHRNLEMLQKQAALYGAGTVPLHLHNHIEEEKREIEKLKKLLGR